MSEYSEEQFWKIYELLPDDLKRAVFAVETANNISLACELAGLEDERVSEVARWTGDVLTGFLPTNAFAETLEKEVGLKTETAKKIAHQINRLIFSLVKESLAALYEEGKAKIPGATLEPEEKTLDEEKLKEKDSYRESVE